MLLGAAWQRCRVHFLRNVLAQVPKGNAEMVAAAIRTIFAQPDAEHVRDQLDVIAGMLGRQFPQGRGHAARRRRRPARVHRLPGRRTGRRSGRTNPLERLNKEIKRRTDVVGVFPNPAALLRLAGAVLVEAHDEWQAADRRYLSEASMALLTPATQGGGGARRTDPGIVPTAEPHTDRLTPPRDVTGAGLGGCLSWQ